MAQIMIFRNRFQNKRYPTGNNRVPFSARGKSMSAESRLKIGFLCFIAMVFIAIPLYGSEDRERFVDDRPDIPWHITADEINYEDKTSQYTAKGNVTINKNDKRLTADYVRFDHKTMKVYARGHVIMTDGKDILVGDIMEFDLNAETGAVYNGSIFIKESHFFFKGDKIEKTDKQTYAARQASLSTCEGDRPAWKITGRDLKLTVEGYGVVKHAALWIKDIPVIYSPYLFFPVKRKRQSGLLAPLFGYSDRKGAQYFQPFYWAINRGSDATLYAHYMERRGNKIGLEYRYASSTVSKGALMLDILKDRKIDDGTFESAQNWGYSDDAVSRPNADRYWLRGKHDMAFPFGFSAMLDIDIVSDQDYLKEFKDGYTGYTQTESYFYNQFGRTMDDYNDPVRINRFNVNKKWPRYNLNSEIRWYDDVIARRQEDMDTTLQQLPFVDFFAAKQRLFATPLYFDMNSRYDHFYREDGTKGHRMDIYPRAYLPIQFKTYATLEPSLGMRGTRWRVEEYENMSMQTEENFHREMVDLKLDLFSEMFRIYRPKNKAASRIKHLIRPQLAYEYVPYKIQNDYPYFDESDRIAEKNLITYSIINTIIAKSEKMIESKNDIPDDHLRDNGVGKKTDPIYHQALRFKLQQSYDINEAREDDPSKWTNQKRREPFSPIYAELELNSGKLVFIRADTEWSPYANEFNSHNASITLTDEQRGRVFVEHRFRKDVSESIYTSLLFPVSDRISTYTDYERNLFDDKRLKFGLGAVYHSQCWSVDLYYAEDTSERKFAFQVNLIGLGGIGI